MIAEAASVLARSPALQAREREIVSRHAQSLAALFAQETGAPIDDVEAYVVASSLMAVHHAVVMRVRAPRGDGTTRKETGRTGDDGGRTRPRSARVGPR